MIESVSGIGSASMSAGVRSLTAAAAPTQGPSFDQALAQVVGSAVDTLQAGKRSPSKASKARPRR